MNQVALEIPQNPIAVGCRAPDFLLRDQIGAAFRLYNDWPGRSLVLVLLPTPLDTAGLSLVRVLLTRAPIWRRDGGALLLVAAQGLPTGLDLPENCKFCHDPGQQVLQAYRQAAGLTDAEPAVLVLDANRRVAALFPLHQEAEVMKIDSHLPRALSAEEGADTYGPTAPILQIPRLLDDALCDQLISYWERGNIFEGTVGSVDQDGEFNRVYHDRKRRLDCKIEEPDLHRRLELAIGQRIAPELEKAFHFAGFHFERFLLVCYDSARQDFFQPHRDNLSPGTADRRFAVSVNLNDDYEGGELSFPEFGADRYTTDKGGAIVFSCSLIHEAMQVTKGRRFVLLNMCRANKGRS